MTDYSRFKNAFCQRSVLLLLAGAVLLGSSFVANANYLIFRDESKFDNFVVYHRQSSGSLKDLEKVQGNYRFKVDDADFANTLHFAIKFSVPGEQFSSFSVRNAQPLQINIEISPSRELSSGYEIPVYYFNCIGKCGFDQIDPITTADTDRVFERFFKSAQMTEHYFLRLNSRDSPEARRSFRLWRDAAHNLGAHHFNWWRIPKEVATVSAETFEENSSDHGATLKYISEVNN